jgi:hypothetical protein
MFAIISKTARGWQLTVAQWGHGLKGARRHWFATYTEAVDAAQQLNPVRIMHSTR